MRNIKLFFERARNELAAEGTEVRAQATPPKLGKPLVEIVERDEIQHIEDAADSDRDKLIVRVLADTGLRVGELVKLRLRDLVESNKVCGRWRRRCRVGRPRAACPFEPLSKPLLRHGLLEPVDDVRERRDLTLQRFQPFGGLRL